MKESLPYLAQCSIEETSISSWYDFSSKSVCVTPEPTNESILMFLLPASCLILNPICRIQLGTHLIKCNISFHIDSCLHGINFWHRLSMICYMNYNLIKLINMSLISYTWGVERWMLSRPKPPCWLSKDDKTCILSPS